MAKLSTAADVHVDAPADVVLDVLRDLDGHHRRILPPAFTDFEVLCGGPGQPAVTQFKFTLGGRTTEQRTLATEPEPGLIRERVLGRDMVTEFRVVPEGDGSHVVISTVWTPMGGLNGFFERLFAPSMLRKVYEDELERLVAYAPAVAAPHAARVAAAQVAAAPAA